MQVMGHLFAYIVANRVYTHIAEFKGLSACRSADGADNSIQCPVKMHKIYKDPVLFEIITFFKIHNSIVLMNLFQCHLITRYSIIKLANTLSAHGSQALGLIPVAFHLFCENLPFKFMWCEIIHVSATEG